MAKKPPKRTSWTSSKDTRTVIERFDDGTSAVTRRGKTHPKNPKRGFTTRTKIVDPEKGTITKHVERGRGSATGTKSVKHVEKNVGQRRAQRAANVISAREGRLKRKQAPKNPAVGRDIPLPPSK